MTTATRTDLKQQVLAILQRHVGRNNPIKAAELCVMFGYSPKNTYVVREPIAELIREGYPICAALASPEGYFMAETYQEVNEYAESLRERGIKDILRRRDVRRAAQRYFTGAMKLL